jgi:peptidoglycan/LPS O-acetylase OafA/YrhL
VSSRLGVAAQASEKARDPLGTLLAESAPMTWKPSRAVVLSLIVSLFALALAVYGATGSPAEAPARPPLQSLSAARYFVLLPDGRVEITDAFSRRVFRWDGRRWQETESLSLPRPAAR